jgi:hypothetical protein
MTSTQTGTSQKEFMTVYHPTQAILTDMGHEVTRRTIQVDEDLSEYDRIICSLFPVEKLSATRKYSIFDAIARYPEKIMLMFDDWQYFQFQSAVGNCLRGGRFWNWVDKFEFCNPKDKAIILAKPAIRDRIFRAAMTLANDLTYPLLYPMFPWGKKENIKVNTTGVIHTFDMNMYAMDYAKKTYNIGEIPEVKEKLWIMGSMFDQESYVKKLNLYWPTKHLGYKKKVEFIPERDLCNKVYMPNWGIISHKYEQLKGDGWWRARWIHALLCGNIILSYDEETEGLPVDFFFSTNEIEGSSNSQLRDIAVAQKEAVMGTFMDYFDSCEYLDRIVTKGF